MNQWAPQFPAKESSDRDLNSMQFTDFEYPHK